MKNLDQYISNISFAFGLAMMTPESIIISDAIRGTNVSEASHLVAFISFLLGLFMIYLGIIYLKYQESKQEITSSRAQKALRQLIHYAE